MAKTSILIKLFFLALLPAACSTSHTEAVPPFTIGAIPDQDPEKLQRGYTKLAEYLSQELGVPVRYKPVIDYAAAVTAFRVGDLDMVWFGGLTGVQARLQVDGAEALVQRDVDKAFTSVFIANASSGIPPIRDVAALSVLKGHTFTFGSETSTSGRLMPQYFLSQAGVTLADFAGQPGFSGSHDKTIALVEAGSFDAGVLNSQLWHDRVASGDVDLEKVDVIFETPPYHDYHWLIRPDVKRRYGADFPQRVAEAFLRLDATKPKHADILNFFGAEKFIVTENDNYRQIEAIARDSGQIVD